MTSSAKFKIFLFLILILNIFLKVHGIDKNSLWIDEAYSINEAQFSVQTIILHSSESDNPPLYYLILHFWTKLFGVSEMAVRSLSAVFSILTSVLIFILVSRNFNLLIGVFSTLFFTFSNENLYYAQETRTYSLVVFLTVISIGVFFLLYKKRNIFLLIVLTIANIFLIYSHYLSILIPLMEVCVATIFFKNKRFFIEILLSTFIVLLCFIPWIQYPLSHAPKEGSFWLQKPTFSNFKGILIGFANNKITLILCFIILAFAFITKIYFNKTNKKYFSFEETSLLVFTFFPIIFVYFIAGFVPVFLLRYLLFASIPFYILFILLLNTYLKREKAFIIAASVLICSTIFSIKLHPTKDENWREAVKKVKELKGKNDEVILSASYTALVFSYYYDRDIFIKNKTTYSALLNENILPINGNSPGDLDKFRDSKKLIGVYCHELLEDPNNTIKKELNLNFRIVESFDFEKVKVVLYENLQK